MKSCPACGLGLLNGADCLCGIEVGHFETDFIVAMCDVNDPESKVSSEELRFWNRIWDEYIRDSEDRTSLLIFADWLDERGDVRGELIRLTIDAETRVEKYTPFATEDSAFEFYRIAGKIFDIQIELGYLKTFKMSQEEKDVLATSVWLELMHENGTALTPVDYKSSEVWEYLVDELKLPKFTVEKAKQNASRIYYRILKKQGKGP